MLLGRLLTIINFTLLGTAIAIYLLVPSIADLFLYVLLAWMFGSIVLFYLPISRRPIGSRAPPPAAAAPATSAASAGASAGTPLATSSGAKAGPGPASPAANLTFCIYCGDDLPAGATFCPACGKPVRRV